MRDRYLFYCVCILTPLAILSVSKQQDDICKKPSGSVCKKSMYIPSTTYSVQDDDNSLIFVDFYKLQTNKIMTDSVPEYENKSLQILFNHMQYKER